MMRAQSAPVTVASIGEQHAELDRGRAPNGRGAGRAAPRDSARSRCPAAMKATNEVQAIGT
jgi:hypothetical protein